MPRALIKTTATLSLIALTACGGGGGGGDGPKTMTVGPNLQRSGTANLFYNSGSNFLTSDGIQNIVSRAADRQKVTGTPNIVTPNLTETSYTVRANDDRVFAFAYATNGLADGTNGLLYGTASPAEIPVRGSTTMTGEYRGMLVVDNATNDNRDYVDNYVSGDVSLDINFTDDIVSGRITNRRLGSMENGTLYTNPNGLFYQSNDVVLQQAAITTQGIFTGSTAGGGLTSNVYTSANRPGSYSGAIGETSTAGVFTMPTTPLTTEIGAFYTQQ